MINKRAIAFYALMFGMCWNYLIPGRLVLYASLAVLFLIAVAANRYYKPEFGVDLVPLLFSYCWLYGFSLGIIKGNIFESVMSNFFGMSLYFIYYSLCSLRFSINNILTLIRVSAIVNSIFFYISAFLFLAGGQVYGETLGEDLNGQMAGFRLYWSMGMLLVVGQLCLYFSKYVGGLKLKISEYLLCFFMLISVLGTFSKGFILQFILSCTVIFLFSLGNNNFRIRKIKFNRLLILIIGIVIIFTFLYAVGFIDSFLFSIEYEFGNGDRDEQRKFLVDEWTIIGEGLGAVLKSGYSRDDMGYGFELNYENLIHKLGVIAILPFSLYIYTLYKVLYLKKTFEIFGLAIGLMSYLISAYGNPFLFSPLAVLIHVFVLYLIRVSLNLDRQRRC